MIQALTSRARPIPHWRPVAWVAGAAAVLLLAAWAVPPMLDWGRFRTAIASIAAARLGRPVVIGGDISLRLLPQAVLTAADVTLADQGDGISVQVPALRLQVATLPLLAGQVVLRDLVLSAPVLHLPWSLPGGIGRSTRPQVPHPFAARIENGTLRIGAAEITGITAAIRGGPAAGGAEAAAPDAVPVAAFGAEGFAAAGGRSWRFTGALGAPDADGVSAIDISVRGQGPVADTGGTLQGTVADGVMQGRLRASGPDLSLLMPATAAAWTADAPFVADGSRIEANAIGLSLGGAPADGALVLHLDSPAHLDGHLHAAALDLNGWAMLLRRSLRAGPAGGVTLPLRIGLSAESARLLGGDLSGVQATLVSDANGFGFDHAEASLPGGARLAADRARLVHGEANQLALSGAATLSAPDLHTTLAWLRMLAPSLADAVPAGVLRQADLSGALTLQPGSTSVSGLAGRLDGSPVSGSFAIRLAGRPSLAATLALGELSLDPWLAGAMLPASLAAFGQRFTGAETSLHIKAAHATLRGGTLDGFVLDAATGLAGLSVARAEAVLLGARLNLAGALAPDGRVAGLRLSANAAALDDILPRLPDAWRWAPGLWHGPGTVQFAADGPPGALALQLRADASDVVLEADSVRDTSAATGTTTLTLRHPGAPRLLNELRIPQALGLPAGFVETAQWLGTGALTLRAHLQDAPSRLVVQDFDFDAAALRMSGQATADWSGERPALSGRLAFEQLALPDSLPALKPAAGLAGWTTRFRISADTVTVGFRAVATQAAATLATGSGHVQASAISASVDGGKLTGDAEADPGAPQATARLTLAGADLAGPLTGWPIDITAGKADIAVALSLSGTSLADLSGDAHARLYDATVTGFSLAQLTAAAPLRTKAGRAAVQAALTQGETPGLSGGADAAISHGQLTLGSAALHAPSGSAAITGGADLAGGTVDAHLVLSPGLPDAAGLGLRLSGHWARLVVVPDQVRKKK